LNWKRVLIIGGLAGISVWALVSGHLEALLLWVVALVGSGSKGKEKEVEKRREVTDTFIGEVESTIEEIEKIEDAYEQEVTQIEDAGNSADITDIINSANERERRRNKIE
jgi:septal ring factor EnvC (AmiA/AmiB activator)